MLGIEFHVPAKTVRQILLSNFNIITGFSEPDVLRILPPLGITFNECELFINSLSKVLQGLTKANQQNASV
jgi:acetylornithine aminotransferase